MKPLATFIKQNNTIIAIRNGTIIGKCNGEPDQWKDWKPYNHEAPNEEAQKVLVDIWNLFQESLFMKEWFEKLSPEAKRTVLRELKESGNSEEELREFAGNEAYDKYS